MSMAFVALGVVLLLVNFFDLVRTVFDVGRGAAPITGRVSDAIWRALIWGRRRGLPHRLVESFGILAVMSVLFTWVTFLFVGWTLVFHGAPEGVLGVEGDPAALLDRAYVAAGSLFGLSFGDVVAGSPGWRFVTVIAALNGGIVITLAITYLVPVANAATERRRFAQLVTSLGRTPDGIVLSASRVGAESVLGELLLSLNQPLADLGQRHLAYPVLHYFHAHDPTKAVTVNIAALDEALILTRYGIAEDARPAPGLIEGLRYNLDVFFETYPMEFDREEHELPPEPTLDRLREAGIPTVSDEEFASALERLADHRRGVAAVVAYDGWGWEDVVRARTG